jgi:hypothetical protein
MKFYEAAKYYYYPGMHEPGAQLVHHSRRILDCAAGRFRDAIISFLRVEGLLEPLFGDAIASDLGRSFRGPYVHMPLLVLAIVIAALTRTLGFIWLACSWSSQNS